MYVFLISYDFSLIYSTFFPCMFPPFLLLLSNISSFFFLFKQLYIKSPYSFLFNLIV